MNIKIDYNTVSFRSHISCNDQTIQRNLEQTIEGNKHKRITDWFEPFITRVKEESNNDMFSIEINGCDHYEKIFIDSVLEKEGGLIGKKKVDPVTDESVLNKYKDIDSLINYALGSKEVIVEEAITPNLDNIEKLRSNKVEVPVIATMSSGKSTLLNALIGQDFLYEDTGTATATTCKIKINNNFETFVAQAIDNETLLEESSTEIGRFLEKWNSSANNDKYSDLKLHLEGPVKNLNSSNLELNFIDTPGPNSAKYKDHRFKTVLYLKDNQKLPIVLYVLDPEKMDSKDDDKTLKEIRNVLRRNKQNLDRIIFVYNKVDRENLEKKSLDSVLQKVITFLKNYGIVDPKIFPVSAKYAKLAQLSSPLSRNEKGELNNYRHQFTPEPEGDYPGYQLLEYSPLTQNQKDHLKERSAKTVLDSDLVYSGLAAIKLYIEDYISNHHQKNQYKDLMDVATKVSNLVLDKIELEKEHLKSKTAEEQKKNRERTIKEINELNERKTEALQDISKIALNKDFIREAQREIDKSFSRLKDKSARRSTLNPTEANNLIEEINATISDLLVTIKTDIISKMNDEGVSYLNQLKEEVANAFELDNQSLEAKTFNSELLNNINVLDISEINNYKTEKVKIKIRVEEKEVESTKWYKRIFGIKDTVKYNKSYEEINTEIDVTKFYIDIVDPISKQFNKIVGDCVRQFEMMFLDYNNSFKSLVNHSFDKSMHNVYEYSNKELALNLDEKTIQLQKLDEIFKAVSILKKQKINEKIYREPVITC